MRHGFIFRLVMCSTLTVVACTERSPGAAENTALAEARLWVPGGLDYARFDALMAVPVRDAITTAVVDAERGTLIDEARTTTAAQFARNAANSGASVVTGIARPITRQRTRPVDNGVESFYRTRYVQFSVTDATDIDGNPIALGPLWVQDMSEFLEVSPGMTVRIRPIPENLVTFTFATLVAATGRVVLMTRPQAGGEIAVVDVMPMDQDEIITPSGRSGENADATRGRFEDLRPAYDAVPIMPADATL